MLPSPICGSTTETVGLFRCDPVKLADWLEAGLGRHWRTRAVRCESIGELGQLLEPGAPLIRRAVIPWRDWAAVLTDGPLGTDVGTLPSLAARELGCVALRATATDDSPGRYGAVILEVFDPEAVEDHQRCRRSIAAANDGGRWVFEQHGSPLGFEDVTAYRNRRVRDRFTPEMLSGYLDALGVPTRSALGLEAIQLVEQVL